MLTIVTDLFLTDSFLIKGEVEKKYARLSHMLDEYRKYFLRVRNATLVDLNTCDRIQTPLLQVNMDEILLAHDEPVGLKTLAVSVGEEQRTIEDAYEPYLIQQGYITRTAQGRVATARAYRHFGLQMGEKSENDLFGS